MAPTWYLICIQHLFLYDMSYTQGICEMLKHRPLQRVPRHDYYIFDFFAHTMFEMLYDISNKNWYAIGLAWSLFYGYSTRLQVQSCWRIPLATRPTRSPRSPWSPPPRSSPPSVLKVDVDVLFGVFAASNLIRSDQILTRLVPSWIVGHPVSPTHFFGASRGLKTHEKNINIVLYI